MAEVKHEHTASSAGKNGTRGMLVRKRRSWQGDRRVIDLGRKLLTRIFAGAVFVPAC